MTPNHLGALILSIWNIVKFRNVTPKYHSHSIIANLKYMLHRAILMLLFQEVPCRANHFVIGEVITK